MLSLSKSRWALALLLPLGLAGMLLSGGPPSKLPPGKLPPGKLSQGKRPVPPNAALDKAHKLVREVFSDDLENATGRDAHVKLAAELLQQARDARDDLALRYVLLSEARSIAALGGDAALAFSAIDETARTFAIDALASKAAALQSAVNATDSKEGGKAVLDLTLPLLAEALDTDSYGPPACSARWRRRRPARRRARASCSTRTNGNGKSMPPSRASPGSRAISTASRPIPATPRRTSSWASITA